MVYKTDRLLLHSVREALSTPVNDVFICEELKNGGYYTLLIVREHTAARLLLDIMNEASQQGRSSGAVIFSGYGDLGLAFAYRQERPLEQFCIGQRCSMQEGAEICVHLIVECMACRLPWPVLYLILTQNQINIQKDRSIYFGYQLDLSGLDKSKGEKECAACAGSIVQRIINSCAGRPGAGAVLLRKKLEKGGYRHLIDLYRDIKLMQSPEKRAKAFGRIRAFVGKHQEAMLRLLLVLCVVFGILALAMLVSQMLWGEIPFLRIFVNSFRVIGTQSLLQ